MALDIAAIKRRAAVENMNDRIAVADAWTDRNELLAERAELIAALALTRCGLPDQINQCKAPCATCLEEVNGILARAKGRE